MNERIRVPRVVVIAGKGEKLGEMATPEALALARGKGMDLVEVDADARPPVCRIIDYGKHLYDLKKKSKRNRQKGRSLKEVKFRPKIDAHDLDTKVRHIRGFLEKGDNVKVTIVFRRGREMIYKDRGVDVAKKVMDAVADLSKVEKHLAKDNFNTMMMTLVPKLPVGARKEKKSTIAKAKAKAAAAAKAETEAKSGAETETEAKSTVEAEKEE